ncbi:PREDICTED: kinesin-associated protein 3-like [Amphimedon queenslandica]|uniref:Kinesin-associated protein 3 n=2 Tax=Amphimedon queenslandica TaxID=400682 RepID=A0AAN0IIX4_AMPQE|nr:PREDICTED: kinesin-associated protein 3-like [Amphimedon queenslandica]|eukprot:XP_003391582.2 PREDICTED: kinesin-associated protein 3-like [Amphimedon queenslandica]
MYMLNRKLNKPGFQEEKDVLSQSSRGMCQELDACQREITEVASLVDLSDYLELLYEDIPEKVQGTGMILQLARNPDNLLELGSNESLFLALTRVLRDDWRKSIELSSNIIYIFFCFSTFSDFHGVLIHHKVGSLCMAVVEHEVNRHETLVEDAENKRKGARTTSSGKLEYEKAKKRLQTIEKRQDILLRVSLYLLYNLAELPAIEQKMKNKGIVSYLTRLLSRSNEELIILIVSFLKKLSIYGENKDEMAKEKILKRLLQLIPSKNEVLMNVAIHLLLNLSFDPSLREEMITLGYLPKLVAQLS